MPQPFDLDSYFQRIHYGGPAQPTLPVLRDVLQLQMQQIPFEGIDVLLDRGVRVDAAGLAQKMIYNKRGGYCFEQSGLLHLAMKAIGFPVRQHLARVWLRQNPATDAPGAATHTSLRVEVGGQQWLVDPGFGSFMPVEPIHWQMDTPTQTSWGSYRLTPTRNGWMLSSMPETEWLPLYEILDADWQPIDFTVANHYVATHPASHFRHQLHLARTLATERRTIANNIFRRVGTDGSKTEETLDAAGLTAALPREFDLDVDPDWQPILQSFADGHLWRVEELETES